MLDLYTFDCETDPFKHGRIPKPFIWGLYSAKTGFEKFTKTEDFAERIKNIRGVGYAHNGGRFDFIFLSRFLNSNTKIRLINGRLASAHVGDFILRDSFCIFPTALKSYKKDEFDYTKLEAQNRKKYKVEIEKYLKNDCIYLYEMVEKWRKEYGSGLTLATCGMHFWRKNFNIPTFRTSKGFYKTFQPYYFGGRVEAFKKGIFKEKVKIYDINSAYPYAMQHNHPWGKDYDQGTGWPRDLSRSFLKFNAPAIGAFPIRNKTSISFPRDGEIYTFHCTGWEVEAALETGALKKSDFKNVEYKEFFETIDFAGYVKHFYKIKKAAKKGSLEYIFSKFMMNTLYGKMAANPAKYKNYVIGDADEKSYKFYIDNGWDFCDEIDGRPMFEAPVEEDEQRYYNVATGASITGFVRAMLFKAVWPFKSVFYCDTDSIITNRPKISLPVSDALGDWECEGDGHKIAIAGKKNYCVWGSGFDNGFKLASKGWKATPAQMAKVASGQKVIYKREAPTISLRRGFSFIERTIQAT